MNECVSSQYLQVEASEVTAAPPANLSGSDFAVAQADQASNAGPVTQSERIPTVDVVRGVALLGVVLVNIADFCGPLEMYDDPLTVGNHHRLNLIVWAIRWLFFEGKMRAIFSMLFGAGVILLTERAEQRGSKNVAEMFLRRNMWLTLFGILHFVLFYNGDILFDYGLTALLFLYPCRNISVQKLLIAGVLILAVDTGRQAYRTMEKGSIHNQGLAAQARSNAGKELTREQQNALKKWNAVLQARKQAHDDDLKVKQGSYLGQVENRLTQVTEEGDYYESAFADVLGMMLIGMGLYRIGFLSGVLSYRVYGWTSAIGFVLSLPLHGLNAWGFMNDGFRSESAWMLLYQWGRIPGAIATVALIVLAVKAGTLPWLMRRIAAVGQTALSNYLLASILGDLLFSGFGLYARVEYYQAIGVVLGMWICSLVVSSVWLRYFRFGPAEWVWRSLTYWNRQPMQRVSGRYRQLIGSTSRG